MSLSLIPTVTGPSDDYDHQILLVDGSSRPSSPPDVNAPGDPDGLGHTSTIDSGLRKSGTHLSRKWTLREELARRKYAKWHEERFNGGGEATSEAGGRRETNGEPGGSEAPQLRRDQNALLSHHPKQYGGKEQSEIDILYENQRGSFICGVPLYSRRSLLHFDPAPWTNASFKDSLVDITNAQPPDPTWQWVWRSWYVDMSGDVDEEGWQYSFAFSPNFSWHGTHQWFHSFVRRRRWLRKRVKPRRTPPEATIPGSERFSVHSARDRSREQSRTRDPQSAEAHRQSYTSSEREGGEEHDIHDVRDIGALMATLRSGRIDREKVEAVSSFLEHGQEDIAHLSEHMPEILCLFIFQASRRQLLAKLLDTFGNASDGLKDRLERGEETSDSERQRVDSLQEALRIADEQVKKLEYWSDVKEMTHEGEPQGAADPAQGWGSEWRGVDPSRPEAGVDNGNKESDHKDAGHEDGKPEDGDHKEGEHEDGRQKDGEHEEVGDEDAGHEDAEHEDAGHEDTGHGDAGLEHAPGQDDSKEHSQSNPEADQH